MHRFYDFSVLNRRVLLQRAILLAGGASMPSLAAFAEAEAKGAKSLASAQFAILDDVVETMIPATDTPGARGAGVPQAFDALMRNWASKTSKATFIALLNDIDRKALAEEGQAFTALAPEQKTAFLARYDKSELPKARRRHDIVVGGTKYPLDPPYVRFKELVATLYYLSEVGATQELRYEHDPGVWDPAMKMTPETRAWAISV